MRDFNFFDSYIKVQARPNQNRVLIVILFALVVALLIFYQILLINKAKAIEGDITEVDAYINSASTIEKVATVDAKQLQADELQILYTNLSTVALSIEANDTLDDMLIEQVNAQLPEGAFLSELGVSNELITIKGYSLEYNNIAQFAYNLRNSGLTNILIPNITESNGSYLYTITANVRSEVSYEN